MDNSEFYDYENRRYIQPTLSRDEQLSFISTLRDIMGGNNAQINTQTRNLGTDVPSNLGGLTGSNSYFTQRYQTIPVENTVNTLKATAQAKALNDLMSNYEAQMKNRANQAYRRATRTVSSSGGSGGDGGDTPEGGVTFEETDWTENTETIPPKEEDYWISGEEQTNRIVVRTGLPDWLVNILKIFGAQ